MGEVWEGVHVGQGVPVAVKVITAARARDPRYREAFRNEVRAVAGLDHPGIVHVFDYGEIDAAAEEQSLGRLVAGSPFLAMELADGGSLRSRPVPRTWEELRGLLRALLDVLAHAHARGVIHRDIKPGNVLIFGNPDEDSVPSPEHLRLTDFGLAHATDRGERAMRGTSGTPTYMAPEQFLGQWRDFGPWTDLYALGCMAYAFASGAPPFRSGGIVGLRQAHLSADPAPLSATLPVPGGFEAWVLRLMDKDVRVRFQTAADAAFALAALGDPAEEAPPEVLPADAVEILASRFTLDASWADTETTRVDDEGPDRRPEPPGEMAIRGTDHLCPRRLPPLPETWRTSAPPQKSMRLVGAGLGLYGLRSIPLVGRSSERDHLWAALRRTRDDRVPQLVAIRGGAGTGKTRLAQWISRRAAELGNAVVVSATHSQGGGSQDGLARLVARALGAVGQNRAEMLRRVEGWLRRRGVTDPYEWTGLVEMVWPTPEEEIVNTSGFEPRFNAPTERYALLHRLLGHLSEGLDERAGGRRVRRPVLVLLDDLQWGADAFGLARYLLHHDGEGPPILMVATVREEALEALGAEAAELEHLLEHPRASTVRLAPLEPDDTRSLVRELLGLEPGLARQVEERTAGNPLFAVQLVGDWVQRGVLEVSGSGFVLRPGEEAILPDDIHALWGERIDRLVALHGEPIRTTLEIAALLGAQVEAAEWRGACSVARAPIPSELEAELFARRLATPQPTGWAFAHGMLRESLVRRSEESGRAPAHHDACATTLQIRFAVARQPGLAERLGRHLVAAGRLAEALTPLREGARERRLLSAYPDALRLLDQHEAILGSAGVPGADPRWGESWVDRAEVLVASGRLIEAEQLAIRVVKAGRVHAWPHLVATALRQAGTVSIKLGRLADARERLRDAERAAHLSADDVTVARCQLLLGDLARLSGKPRDAMHHAREAFRKFAAIGDAKGQADALVAQAAASRAQGDLEHTERNARQAIPLYEQVGSRFGVASCQNVLGEVLRARGRLDAAAEAYALAESLLRRLGSKEHRVPQVNRGLVLLARGDAAAAEAAFRDALAASRADGRRAMEGALAAFLLPCAAHRRDWAAWRQHALDADAILEESGFVDGDIAWAAQQGAELAARLGYTQQALVAYRLALRQWQALGDRAQAHEARRRIEALTQRARPGDA